MPKPTPEEILKAIEESEVDDEIERVLAMSDEERRKELEGAGYDMAELHARADAMHAKIVGASAAAKVVDLAAAREKRRPRPVWLALVAAAAAVVVVGGGATLVATRTPSPAPPSPTPSIPSAPPVPPAELLAQERQRKAQDLRARAGAEYADGKWADCAQDLSDAAELDPAGDSARAVQRLRKKALRANIEAAIVTKTAPGPRSLGGPAAANLVGALAPSRGQALLLVCAREPEPAQLCAQLAAAMTKAGWVVTRTTVPADAGAPLGVHVQVSTDADDAAQAAADALADGLQAAYLRAHGPDDMTPGDAPLRLTIGPQ